MALTLSSVPIAIIHNAPTFNVTTSLVEGSGYNNVRVRANIYIDGVVKAVLEQPKGLASFEFYKLLGAFCGRLNNLPTASNLIVQPTMTDELLTGWTNEGSGYTTWTTSGRQISDARVTAAPATARSNNLGALVAGDIIIFGIENDWSTTAPIPHLRLTDGTTVQEAILNTSNFPITVNKIRFFVVTSAMAQSYIEIYNTGTTSQQYDGTFTIKKIPVGDTYHIGNQCIYYKIGFQEFYENAAGVTVEGAETKSNTYLFVPAIIGSGETLTLQYLMTSASNRKFLHDSIRAATNFKRGIGMELRMLFVSDETYFKLYSNTSTEIFGQTLNCGYGFVVITDSLVLQYADAVFTLVLKAVRATEVAMSEVLTITPTAKCFSDVCAVEFVGDKGLEFLLFKGSTSILNKTEKEFYKNANRINLPFSSNKKKEIALRTLYENTSYIALLWQLINSTGETWMYKAASPYYTIIGVKTDEITEKEQNELVTNVIQAEYYE